MLGHYSAGFTLNTYCHATRDMQADAARKIGGLMSAQTGIGKKGLINAESTGQKLSGAFCSYPHLGHGLGQRHFRCFYVHVRPRCKQAIRWIRLPAGGPPRVETCPRHVSKRPRFESTTVFAPNKRDIRMDVSFIWWGKVDSNHRRHCQQIYSLSHLATLEFPHIQLCWSWWTDSNPRPADYKRWPERQSVDFR